MRVAQPRVTTAGSQDWLGISCNLRGSWGFFGCPDSEGSLLPHSAGGLSRCVLQGLCPRNVNTDPHGYTDTRHWASGTGQARALRQGPHSPSFRICRQHVTRFGSATFAWAGSRITHSCA